MSEIPRILLANKPGAGRGRIARLTAIAPAIGQGCPIDLAAVLHRRISDIYHMTSRRNRCGRAASHSHSRVYSNMSPPASSNELLIFATHLPFCKSLSKQNPLRNAPFRHMVERHIFYALTISAFTNSFSNDGAF
jgi:hypothetical protein